MPGGRIIGENGSHVTLTCNIQASPSTIYSIHWEFNGTVYPHNFTTRELVASAATTGGYRCIVAAEYFGLNTSLVTTVSDPVFLELPSMFYY